MQILKNLFTSLSLLYLENVQQAMVVYTIYIHQTKWMSLYFNKSLALISALTIYVY